MKYGYNYLCALNWDYGGSMLLWGFGSARGAPFQRAHVSRLASHDSSLHLASPLWDKPVKRGGRLSWAIRKCHLGGT